MGVARPPGTRRYRSVDREGSVDVSERSSGIAPLVLMISALIGIVVLVVSVLPR